MLSTSFDDLHPTVSVDLLPKYNAELGCVAGYMRKKPSKSTPGYWTRMSKWPQRWFWVSLDLHGPQNYQLCYLKHGENTSHTVQRVYHLVNGTLERTSETSFVLHIPNGEDLCLQCDSILETNRWLSTLAQLIHVANIRSESLSSAYIANLPNSDSIQTCHSRSWANDSISLSFEDNVETYCDKNRKVDLFVKPVVTKTDISHEREDNSDENSILVDYHSKSKSSLNYEALDEPGHALQGNYERGYSNDLSLVSTDVPLLPNTHDRDFFNQLQHVIPLDADRSQRIDEDCTLGYQHLDSMNVQEAPSELLPLVHEIYETLPSELQKIETVTQSVSSIINNSIQEAVDTTTDENQGKAIARIPKCQDFLTDISNEENASFSTHVPPTSEMDWIKNFTDEEKQQQQLPILNPDAICGGHLNLVEDFTTKPDIPISDIPFIVSEPSSSPSSPSSPSSNSTSTCFEGLKSNEPAEADIIKINNLQGTKKNEIQMECIWVNKEEEQDITCMSNSLVFEGLIGHTKTHSKTEINSKNNSRVLNGQINPPKSPINKIHQFRDSCASLDLTDANIQETLLNVNEETPTMGNVTSFANMASGECNTNSLYESPNHSFHDSSTQLDVRQQNFCDDYELRDNNEYGSVKKEALHEIDGIVIKILEMLVWVGSFAHFFKAITPILLFVWKIVHFTVIELFTVAKNIVWLLDVFVFEGWFFIQSRSIFLWEKIVPTNNDICKKVHNVNEVINVSNNMTDLAESISSKDVDLSLQSSCL